MTVSIRPEKRSYFIPAGVISDWICNMNAKTFFLYIFLYHLLVVFQGLDFNDEGFHLAFYQQIFSDPESVQYAFWGWLSGILGGFL